MTALTPTDQYRGLRFQNRDPVVELLLSDRDGKAGSLAGSRVAGATLRLSPIHPTSPIPPEAVAGKAAAIVEVAAGDPHSIARFQHLTAIATIPVLAAVYEAPLALVRVLIRSGARDVLPLPLDLADLESTLAPLLAATGGSNAVMSARGKLVSVIKSGGGVGATAVLTQLAVLQAQRGIAAGDDCCLIDLDVQFGDAAFQLNLRPSLSLSNLLDAGSRLDGALLIAATTTHASGLKLVSSPDDILPLGAYASEQLLDVIDVALGQFGTVFLDLPSNWTDWSMSLVARSDLVLLISELTVPALRGARRQIELIEAQELEGVDLRVVLNRHEDRLFKVISRADAEQALGRRVSYTLNNEPTLMRAATDQGMPISEIRRRSTLSKQLGKLADDIANLVHQEQ